MSGAAEGHERSRRDAFDAFDVRGLSGAAEEHERSRRDAFNVRRQLTTSQLAALRGFHKRQGICAAHDEGQYCCMDYLLDDTREEWP